MERLYLKFPTLEDKQNVLDFKAEFLRSGQKMHGVGGLSRIDTYEEWFTKICNDTNEDTCTEGRVPSTLYLVYRKEDDRLVGIIQIRHYLNQSLLNYAGHIGDCIRPSEQRKGYGTEQISLALVKCKLFGIKKVLMTCFVENIASAKTIIKNNGCLENEVQHEEGLLQRYWIDLTSK